MPVTIIKYAGSCPLGARIVFVVTGICLLISILVSWLLMLILWGLGGCTIGHDRVVGLSVCLSVRLWLKRRVVQRWRLGVLHFQCLLFRDLLFILLVRSPDFNFFKLRKTELASGHENTRP